jgi:hypothetical protein
MQTDPTASNGRLPSGQFAAGNQAAAGRTSRAAELRQAFSEAITVADVSAIARAMVKLACDGDVGAARFVLDRALGKPGADDHDAQADAGRNRVLTLLAQPNRGDTDATA